MKETSVPLTIPTSTAKSSQEGWGVGQTGSGDKIGDVGA